MNAWIQTMDVSKSVRTVRDHIHVTVKKDYGLNEDGKTCSISCKGKLFTEVSGSFHTPHWSLRYPSEDFSCEWEIDIENITNDSVIEISFNEP